MIFDAVIGLVFSLLTGVLGMIPPFTLDLTHLAGSLGAALNGANSVFPVVVLGGCILAMVGLRFFIAFCSFIAWVWDKIPMKFS